MAVEIPTVFADWSASPPIRFGSRFDSDLEAMMWGDEPNGELDRVRVLREAVVDCLDQLGDEDRFVLEAIWFEGITVRALADRLGIHKSRTHRIAQRAVARLGRVCEDNPTIVGYLRG